MLFKIDFPKIPFPADLPDFENLVNPGGELIEHHLLKRNYPRSEMPVFAVEGDNKAENYFYVSGKRERYFCAFILSVRKRQCRVRHR